jgi:hypothetical protein
MHCISPTGLSQLSSSLRDIEEICTFKTLQATGYSYVRSSRVCTLLGLSINVSLHCGPFFMAIQQPDVPSFLFYNFFRRPSLTCPHCSLIYTKYIYICVCVYIRVYILYIIYKPAWRGG